MASQNNESQGPSKDSVIVKIHDKWVNLSAWAKVHPGGSSSIKRFHGQDATEAFDSLHSEYAKTLLNKMKPVQPSEEISKKFLQPTNAAIAFRELRASLEKEGWFERIWIWDFCHVAFIVLLAVVGTIIANQHPVIAIAAIGISMQQAGWLGHDYVHGRGRVSKVLGDGIGGLFNGFSSRWWSNKHNKHHVHTNQFGVDDDIQNDPILHLWVPEPEKDHALRAYQHVYYHVVYAFLFVSWRIQSFQWSWAAKDKLELTLIFLNYMWLLSLPIEVAVGSVLLGGFLVAEIVTATHQSEEIIEGISFSYVDDQFKTTRDVTTDSLFMSYLWGGMQYQLEHHLFPTIPKYKYPALKLKIQEFAAKNGLDYRDSSLLEILNMNYETMRRFAVTKSIK